MTMLISQFTNLGVAYFPIWSNRQQYMHTFNAADPEMAAGFEDYRDIVAGLCKAAGVEGEAHMTVDEKVVKAGWSQRRPDAHVDGHYLKDAGHWGHEPPTPSWAHFCNNIPIPRMSVIVASNVPGCIAYAGEFDGEPQNDGDLEHIRAQLGEGELLPANRGFLLSPDCVHESIRFPVATKRSFLRIAIPPL